ncbi:Ppx/GppA phosphatase family protein [Terracoccus luteus]|uniref:Exopolyphosphatase/guanosine-5'-triphosphate, 3'-diphosphate pyrophosphatase n=1 Tax=Terracoccus luteus TaxID=53356 RepID=A0A839PZ61_9MICO|nr:Ppx/GppA phosphatase family protein [Terracoccus luteus]MBB2985681.1 exopolyphosphatase/guanosine-5'-triphosphate,3'-diphosphate pyrophosphatase [Terracoccus luteus]MCP2171333.1 exopolyphosphatase/guanosine-5'-triphosphate,3'-diphosphate pyrophosphatase [Terracoccus luteus]
MSDTTPETPDAPSTTVRVGAVDCGTNSIRLLVADIDRGTRAVTDVLRRMEIVRLGHGVDRTGVIAPESMQRTLRVAAEYAASCRELGAERVRFVATSASRDARNAGEFVEGVRRAFAEHWGADVTPEVVSGDEEASLSFTGATGDLVSGGVPGPYLVVDLGGGSTEFVRGTDAVEAARSVDVGCVRMTERHLVSDPPTPDEIAAATRDVDAAIDAAAAEVGFDGIRALVGLAGSVTTITAHRLRLPTYEPERIHLARGGVDETLAACADLLAMTRERRAALPYMHPGRVDVIGAGALVWSRIVTRLRDRAGIGEVITSEHDILDGIALSQV